MHWDVAHSPRLVALLHICSSKFITDHGGHTNAYTSAENTNYQFDINWWVLQVHNSECKLLVVQLLGLRAIVGTLAHFWDECILRAQRQCRTAAWLLAEQED